MAEVLIKDSSDGDWAWSHCETFRVSVFPGGSIILSLNHVNVTIQRDGRDNLLGLYEAIRPGLIAHAAVDAVEPPTGAEIGLAIAKGVAALVKAVE